MGNVSYSAERSVWELISIFWVSNISNAPNPPPYLFHITHPLSPYNGVGIRYRSTLGHLTKHGKYVLGEEDKNGTKIVHFVWTGYFLKKLWYCVGGGVKKQKSLNGGQFT